MTPRSSGLQRNRRSARQRVTRWFTPLTLVVVLVCLLAGSMALLAHHENQLKQERQVWRVTALDADARLDRSGRLHAQLDFTVDFSDVEAHGIWIALPTRTIHPGTTKDYQHHRYGDISAASNSGAPSQIRTRERDDALEVRIGDEDRTVRGLQRYRLSYAVDGLVTSNGPTAPDELSWRVIPSEFEMPVADIDVRLEMPADLTSMTSGTSWGAATSRASYSGRVVDVHQDHLRRGESLTVGGTLPHATVPPSSVPAPFTDSDAFRPALANVLGSLLVALVAGLVLWPRWRDSLTRQDKDRAASALPRRSLAEDGINPAEMIALSEGKVGPKALEVAVLHAVASGAITICPATSAGLALASGGQSGRSRRRRWGNNTNWILGRGASSSDPITQSLVEGLFRRGDQVTIKELRRTSFRPPMSPARRAIARSVRARGWFRHDPVTNTRWWNLGAAATLLLGLGATWWSLAHEQRAAWPGTVMVVAAVVAFLLADRPRARTTAGLQALDSHAQPSLGRAVPEEFRKALVGTIGVAAAIASGAGGDYAGGGGASGGGGFSGGGGW